ncbi:triglyceride lipase-cholesterol esterase [Schizosaccharomyces pombe]|uniref:Probable lipase C14C8.15 n=1 Tax=Schizosaccharomyces pombe (strain 972 / ATCC 24843) TaxID=284812 RepID=TGCE3_SCHPO|nr:putative triglyceride lipase-cholesterol esterase [Schizosaccharomyces pombe]O60095.1 RecName: Full=Probable lipase C14C8.15 [Schizosaccharomyces pombe 972h-]CAA18432.1 triglyceride lipase-cholesterol esterase (predicted) [Schizosaccharomyces pombe]|eukprot:NP_595918.1 putative triglyceride lipase-cholesterol esterase [Schizosaccharomyces pombe]
MTLNGNIMKYCLEKGEILISFLLIALESMFRICTVILPSPLRNWFYEQSKKVYSYFLPELLVDDNANKLTDARDTIDLCALHGYDLEEHFVRTTDGYLLGLHRVYKKKKGKIEELNYLPPVLFIHGLMMNSESWVCNLKKEDAIPFALVEQGYDVWLGNLRGNKYSIKNIKFSSQNPKFWDFSLDSIAIFDIPSIVKYILSVNSFDSISLVGFSQGAILAFAALSIDTELRNSVRAFIALAPAIAPKKYSGRTVKSIIHANSQLLYLMFGRNSMLGSAVFWQAVLYPPVFAKIVDLFLRFFLSWTGKNISETQKIVAYSHLYSFTSVKCFVHWAQITRRKVLQMYDDSPGFKPSYYTNLNRIARYPIENIRLPITLVYGSNDNMVDIETLKTQLPPLSQCIQIPNYEHLDIIMGDTKKDIVIQQVVEQLNHVIAGDYFESIKEEFGLDTELVDGVMNHTI